MRVISQLELARCTKGELYALLNMIVSELPLRRLIGASGGPRKPACYSSDDRAAGLPALLTHFTV